jgi:hypothetical protein
MAIMAAILYLAYLLTLLIVPRLVKRRWGVAASLVATLMEVGLAALLWVLAVSFDPYAAPPIETDESPLLRIRRGQAQGFVNFIAIALIPAASAVVGGGLALAWWTVQATWRSVRGRLGSSV